MADFVDFYKPLAIINAIKDSIVTLPHSVTILPEQLFAPRRSGLALKLLNSPHDSEKLVFWKPAEFFFRGLLNLEAI